MRGELNLNHSGYTMRDLQFWKVIISLGVASIFIFAAMYATQPLLPLFTEEFNVSVSIASMTMSMLTIGLIIGLIVIGFFSDRSGRVLYVKMALIGSTVPFFIMPLTDSFSLIIILRFIQGLALAGVPAAALAYISEEIHSQFTSVATALYISFNSLGGMIGRVFTGYFADKFSWQISFYILGISGLLIFGLLLFILPKSRNFTPSVAGFSKDVEGFLFHLKNPALLIVFGLGIVLQVSFTGIWTFIPFHLTADPFSLSLDAMSYTYFAYGFGVIGSPIAGWLAGVFGIGKVRIAGVTILVTGILLTLGDSIWVIVTGLCVICLGFFTAHSLTAASVGKEATDYKGSASSLYLVSYYIGVAIGSTFLGPLWEGMGWVGLAIFTAVLPVVYVIMIQVYRQKKFLR